MRHCGRSIWRNCYANRHLRSDTKDCSFVPTVHLFQMNRAVLTCPPGKSLGIESPASVQSLITVYSSWVRNNTPVELSVYSSLMVWTNRTLGPEDRQRVCGSYTAELRYCAAAGKSLRSPRQSADAETERSTDCLFVPAVYSFERN